MGFFVQDNTGLETVWFSVLAAISFLCFPFGIRLARRFPQIVAVKLLVRPIIKISDVRSGNIIMSATTGGCGL